MHRFAPLVIAALLAACGDSSNTKADASAAADARGSGDARGDASLVECADSSTCLDPTFPVCDPALHLCEECVGSNNSSCQGEVCSANDACEPCTADAQCNAGLCLPNGTCTGTSGLQVTPAGGSAAACTVADPCSLTRAISLLGSGDALVVLAPGTYPVTATITIASAATLAGRGAIIERTDAGTGPVISATGAASQLELDYVTIEGASDPSTGSGVAFAGGTLTIQHATIQNNAALGVLVDPSFANNVTIERSTIASNGGGGLLATGAYDNFDVSNNFIIYNGHATGTAKSTVGGAALSVTQPAKFYNNTIAFNESDGISNRGGITCVSLELDASSTLVFHNSEPDGSGGRKTDATTQTNQDDYECNTEVFAVATDSANLGFKSPTATPYDFHLTAASPATIVNVATASTYSPIDFDGDTRPQGGAPDLGADEYKP